MKPNPSNQTKSVGERERDRYAQLPLNEYFFDVIFLFQVQIESQRICLHDLVVEKSITNL